MGEVIRNTWAVVTSGPTANSLGVVRSLGERGIPVALLDVVDDSPARFSKYVRQRLCCRRNCEADDLLRVLIDFARKQSERPVLISTGDEETLIFARNRKKLKEHFRLSLPSPEEVERLTNKRLLHALLKEKGVPHPRTVPVPGAADLEKVPSEFSFPFLIKPEMSGEFASRFGQKLFVVRTPEQLARAIETLSGSDIRVVAQELLNADLYHEVYLLFHPDRGAIALTGFDRLRQFPPRFGTASFCLSIRREEAVQMSVDLLQDLQFDGICAIEFIRDRDDERFKMIEVNPRTTLQNRLAAACGASIEYLLYQLLLGSPVSPNSQFREGVLWIDNIKDSISRLMELQEDGLSLSGWRRQFFKAKIQSVLSLSDPAPIFGCWRQAGARALPWLKNLGMTR